MNSETEVTMTAEDKTPSANWVRAVSDFLDTDPTDVLAELGYYDRSDDAVDDPEVESGR